MSYISSRLVHESQLVTQEAGERASERAALAAKETMRPLVSNDCLATQLPRSADVSKLLSLFPFFYLSRSLSLSGATSTHQLTV